MQTARCIAPLPPNSKPNLHGLLLQPEQPIADIPNLLWLAIFSGSNVLGYICSSKQSLVQVLVGKIKEEARLWARAGAHGSNQSGDKLSARNRTW